MADTPDNLVLEHLGALRSDMLALRHDMGELKTTAAGMLQVLAAHDNRLLRIEQKIERIEGRLGMIDPAIP
jgi:hypothetical protein